jgi:hypothetical protein
MKRHLSILGIIALVGSGGCVATTQERQPAATTQPATRYYAPAVASALVFDPPALQYGAVPSFDRQGRSPSAFYGYEQPTVEHLDLYQRDSQRGEGMPDWYDRTTRSYRSTSTYR